MYFYCPWLVTATALLDGPWDEGDDKKWVKMNVILAKVPQWDYAPVTKRGSLLVLFKPFYKPLIVSFLVD